MDFINQLFELLTDLLSEHGGTIGLIAVVLIFLFTFCGRKTRYLFFWGIGITLAIIGIVLLVNLGDIINSDAIGSLSDILTILGIVALLVVLVIFGWRLLRRSGNSFLLQVWLERWVDRIHDAWTSRHTRY